MLFTDSDIIDSNILGNLDSEVSLVAKSTKIPLAIDGPNSICAQATQECGRLILRAMQSYATYPAGTGFTGAHMAAVMNVGVPARSQSRVRLNQIVASESQYGGGLLSAIQLWVAYRALTLLYRDASSRAGASGVDRYQAKMERYEKAAADAWSGLRAEGLPMVYRPLEAPGAKYAVRPGTWGASNLSTVGGGTSVSNQNVVVAVTYCDTGRQYVSQNSNGNAESGASAYAKILIPAGQLLRVDISSLIPPTGDTSQVGLSQGTWASLTATNWNLWVGRDQVDEPLYLQRELIQIATKQVTLSADPVFSGSTLRPGQNPDLSLMFMNVVLRG